MDLLICEVKGGKVRINPDLLDVPTLRATLARLGCCPPAEVEHHVAQLLRRKVADMNHPAGMRCRARIAIFAGRRGDAHGAQLIISLAHAARSIQRFFAEHHAALHGVRLTQPALASMYLLDKVGVLGVMTSSPPTGGRQA